MWSIARTDVSLLCVDGRAHLRMRSRGALRVTDHGVMDKDQVGEHLRAAGVPAGSHLRVYLGPASCRFLTIERPASLVDDAECQTAVTAAFVRRQGLEADQWDIAIDNSYRACIPSCAIPVKDITEWRALAGEARLRLTWLTTSATARPLDAGALWMVVGDGMVTRVRASRTSVDISSLPIGSAGVEAAIRQAEFALDGPDSSLATPSDIYVLGESARPRLDFRDLLVRRAA